MARCKETLKLVFPDRDTEAFCGSCGKENAVFVRGGGKRREHWCHRKKAPLHCHFHSRNRTGEGRKARQAAVARLEAEFRTQLQAEFGSRLYSVEKDVIE
jgi:competence CoiA-like predicted nuclease